MDITKEKPIKLIATYARVSTSHQEEQQTIKNQEYSLKEFTQKNGYTIVEEYIDDGWSGDILARPALDKLRQDAKNKVWEAILIYDPDRLARRYSYQELIMDELKEAGIEVLFVTVSSPKNSEDKILYGVRGLFAEYERAKISERFRLGKLRKVKEGHILVSEPRYGYDYIPKQNDKHGYYKINPEEARVVKMIFSWVANEGMTLRAVVRRLQKEGIKPRKSKRGVWSTSTLSTMLRNRTYIGEACWGSSYAVVPDKPLKEQRYKKVKKTSRRKKPKEEWIIIPVPPIITTELFEKARKQIEANFALCPRNKKNDYLLAGKISCACGRKRTGEGYANKPNLYYRCSDRVLSFPLPPKCKEKGINAILADKLVWQKIAGLMSSPELMTAQVNRWFKERQSKSKDVLVDVDAQKRQIEKLKKQEERYNKAYGAGVFDLEQLKGYTTPIREKISQLENQIRKATSKGNQKQLAMPNKQEMKKFANKTKEALQGLDFTTKRSIILNTIEKIVGTRRDLQISGFIPIQQYAKFKTNSRNCWSTKRW
ncbi:MAG: recombinase family protein [Candidatus Komeilibacteria bacterium]|jgi:site-specific DNA recombinase|nr:recombinase family protein [Candidatus Komeilibacteria bacterium]MBT4447525.1 recombinase family protein [Candidatus Komeilibacteria bacterium]